ncbi:SDR family NAD(P)-dependent oxidoreductase [Chitinimonas viridis]|uniref:SDR family NAD(P)-dependent oxidoreductase n=1 Tax=Chitinimonas viridis TaxID=664880 RepID=A0ABT8B456_9NEIS|nr:SDR family NAD(P)-dependent oxidoreductase [Chitinimonas viridis]MDN3577042.1 SDR family NAD(P)-dependent oxidoreductase [Chitinimonas viridis]
MTPRLVLITGTSGGIGKATALAFAAAGWQVLAASRQPATPATAAGMRHIQLDPASAADRTALVELLARDYGGRLDCLVNNAGYAQSGPVELLDEAAWRSQLETNVIAPALLTAALLPVLRQGRGCVINVSSVLGRTSYAWQGAYCAAKFGLEGWTESLMLETQGQGIRVHLIEPGTTRSEFGANMLQVGQAPAPYTATALRFAQLRQRLAGRAQPPEKVARVIVRTAQARRAPFRQLVGTDARLAGLLLACLPSSLYVALNRLLARKLLHLPAQERP